MPFVNTDFRHTANHATRTTYPAETAGVTLVDEDADGNFTGVYLRDLDGGLYPCRTVDRRHPEHHRAVVAAWSMSAGELQDLRATR